MIVTEKNYLEKTLLVYSDVDAVSKEKFTLTIIYDRQAIEIIVPSDSVDELYDITVQMEQNRITARCEELRSGNIKSFHISDSYMICYAILSYLQEGGYFNDCFDRIWKGKVIFLIHELI